MSDKFIIAFDEEADKAVGFITVITDNVLSVFIPFVEVLPSYQNRGIGKELMQRMLEQYKDFYLIDTTCDEELKPFYSQFGMKSLTAMVKRNYKNQSGKIK